MCAGDGSWTFDGVASARHVSAHPPVCDGADSCDPAWPGGSMQYTPSHRSSAQISVSISSTVNISGSIGSTRTKCNFRVQPERAQCRALGDSHCATLAHRAVVPVCEADFVNSVPWYMQPMLVGRLAAMSLTLVACSDPASTPPDAPISIDAILVLGTMPIPSGMMPVTSPGNITFAAEMIAGHLYATHCTSLDVQQ